VWLKGKDWPCNIFTYVPLILTDTFRNYRDLFKVGVSFHLLCSVLMPAQMNIVSKPVLPYCSLLGWRDFRWKESLRRC